MRGRAWLAFAVAAWLAPIAGALAAGCMDCPTCDVPPEAWAFRDAGTDHSLAQPTLDEPPACMTNVDTLPVSIGAGPVAHQHRCTAQQITDMATACFASLFADAGSDLDAGTDADADAGGAGADASVTCAAFSAANPSCAECILHTASDAGVEPSAAVSINPNNGAFIVDLGGCSAVLADAGPSCEQTFEDFIFCSEIACGACTTADLDDCLSYAQFDPESACVLNYPMDDACWNALNAVAEDAFQAACGPYPGDPGSQLVSVATTFCGP